MTWEMWDRVKEFGSTVRGKKMAIWETLRQYETQFELMKGTEVFEALIDDDSVSERVFAAKLGLGLFLKLKDTGVSRSDSFQDFYMGFDKANYLKLVQMMPHANGSGGPE